MPPCVQHNITAHAASMSKRRTKLENVCVAFNDETFGETRGMFVADAQTYGADKLWCVLKPIPIDFTGDSDEADAALKRQLEEAEAASTGNKKAKAAPTPATEAGSSSDSK